MSDFKIDHRGVLIKYNGSAEHVIVPDDVIYIGKYAFVGCNFIRSVELPEEVVHIYARAFLNCTKLEKINLPPYLADIGEGAFCGCRNLKQIQFPRRLEKIENEAFQNTGLEEITIPDTLQEIGESVFAGCFDLRKMTLSKNMRYIPHSFLAYCGNLTELVIPEGIESIEPAAFLQCKSLKEIHLPDSIKSLYNSIADDQNSYEFIYRNIRFDHHIPAVRDLRQQMKVNLQTCLNAINYYIFDSNFTINPALEKIRILLQLVQNTPDDERILRYFRKNLTEDVKTLITEHEIETVRKVIEAGIIQKENIDDLIRYTIDQKLYELQVMLMNYKREKIGFEPIEEIANKLLLD